jgi:Na+-transporting NADH:ubiquinone oxidoreductase subunit NqrD
MRGRRMIRVGRDDKQGARLVECGQICFGLFIAICVALHPGFVLKWNEGGMSDYGSHIETALPYTLALLGLAEFSRRAASLYRQSDRTTRRLRRVLYFYSAIVLVMLVSTYVYTLNFTLRDFHFGFGTILILFEVSSSVWMFLLFRRLVWDGIFLIMQIVGSVLCLITIVGVLHVLFFAEMLTGAGFAGLIIHTSRCVSSGVASSSRESAHGLRDAFS